jgi:hypothetical protein
MLPRFRPDYHNSSSQRAITHLAQMQRGRKWKSAPGGDLERARHAPWRLSLLSELIENEGAWRGVLVSFGIGSLSKRQSFPRKRESSPSTAHFRRCTEQIPALAGMTALCNAYVSQMTQVPGREGPHSRARMRYTLVRFLEEAISCTVGSSL